MEFFDKIPPLHILQAEIAKYQVICFLANHVKRSFSTIGSLNIKAMPA